MVRPPANPENASAREERFSSSRALLSAAEKISCALSRFEFCPGSSSCSFIVQRASWLHAFNADVIDAECMPRGRTPVCVVFSLQTAKEHRLLEGPRGMLAA